MKDKLIKVIFEYEDSIDTLTDRPQEWLDEINSYIAINALRNSTSGMSKYKWRSRWKKHEKD